MTPRRTRSLIPTAAAVTVAAVLLSSAHLVAARDLPTGPRTSFEQTDRVNADLLSVSEVSL